MSQAIWEHIRVRLGRVYGAERAGAIQRDLAAVVQRYQDCLDGLGRQVRARGGAGTGWDARSAMLITYGDTLVDPVGPRHPLAVLQEFLGQYVGDLVPWVHLLPFFPWSSDDGFAVEDFRAVNPALGTWADIAGLAENYRLVFDGVINHVSASSLYARGYLAGDPAYRDFFLALPPETDTSKVLRTRNLPLLHDYDTVQGKKWLWTTFSRDQLDLNFANPRVLVEIVDVLLFYAAHGAGVIRLDAIPYLWKQLGTPCAHLPQTHELIKLFRNIYDLAAPGMLLLTETNNPHRENVSYFGDGGDEAQMIYNFTLAPLILHTLVTGDAARLTRWARQVHKVSDRATYLNVTATHDGIGMRPTEGILSEPERQRLVDLAYAHQGAMTGKRNSDGAVSPYELNVNYFDALNDPAGSESRATQIARFLVSQAMALSFLGIPGIYIHSLLGSRNDVAGVQRTGRARSINRAQLPVSQLTQELADESSLRRQVFAHYLRLLRIRREQPAFHPNAAQTVLDLGPGVFALRRDDAESGQSLVAIHNVTGGDVTVPMGFQGVDLLAEMSEAGPTVHLRAYQVVWVSRN